MQRCRERVTFVTFVRARITLVRIELPPRHVIDIKWYYIANYHNAGTLEFLWRSSTPICREVRSYGQLDESPLCIVIARRATLSDISCRSERDHIKKMIMMKRLCSYVTVYTLYTLYTNLCVFFFFFLINKSLSGCLEGHSFCWLNRYDRLLIAFSLFGFEIKMFKMWICIWFIFGPVFVARSNVNRFWWNSMHIYI